ncbi:hypothetical protein PT974_10487 [Cladobotryum mycophilum]|uniref:LysM domain-containing protein n=1 Tax=Cladobotryum mycophilum TaxID=491253 RepID=A0ABR0S9Z5_9HYPO
MDFSPDFSRWIGRHICVSDLWASDTPPPSRPPGPALVPENAAESSNKICRAWSTALIRDYCIRVAMRAHISNKDFLSLNPDVGENCEDVQLGVAYCIATIGNIATSPGYNEDRISYCF